MVKRPKLRRRGQPKSVVSDIASMIAGAVELHRAGDLDAAAQRYAAILRVDPGQVDAFHFLGLVEQQRGHSEKALMLMNRSIELLPDHADFLSNRGNVLKLLGRLDAAADDFRRVLELEPSHCNAMNNLGTVLRERGEFEAAVALYRQAIALDPQHADAYQNLGNALASLNQFEAALDAHREALRLRPLDGESYRHLAGMCYALGRIEQAASLYRAWLEIDPKHPVPQHMLAACTGNGVPDRASDDFIRKSFDPFAASFDRALLRLEYRAPTLIAEALQARLGNEEQHLDILDAGCGTGLIAALLRPRAKTLVGVDLSAQMVERARERNAYDALHVAEIVAFCTNHGHAFDAIIAADTLVYFGALSGVIAAMVHALRPTAHLVFTVERSLDIDAPAGFRLHPHGRYSHTDRYVEAQLLEHGCVDVAMQQVELRKEAGKWVHGSLVTARLPGTAATQP